jgi:hypothetical protein
MKFKTRYIFNNSKTKFSVDFGVCPFMYKTSKGGYASDECPSCYAARLLSVYPATRAKVEGLVFDESALDDFKDDITKISKTGIRALRFYSLADFDNVGEIEFIHAAADIMPVEIFSKTLHGFYRQHLSTVTSHDNVHISLSLNKSWDEAYIERLWLDLIENGLATNCQLNYTFIGQEEVRDIPYISVYHTTRRDKLHLFNKFGYNRVCCGRDKDGKKITDKNTGNSKGSCAKCPLCKLPAADASGNLLTPRRLEEVYNG